MILLVLSFVLCQATNGPVVYDQGLCPAVGLEDWCRTWAIRNGYNPDRMDCPPCPCNAGCSDDLDYIEFRSSEMTGPTLDNPFEPISVPMSCGNGTCDYGNGENCWNCPVDCADWEPENPFSCGWPDFEMDPDDWPEDPEDPDDDPEDPDDDPEDPEDPEDPDDDPDDDPGEGGGGSGGGGGGGSGGGSGGGGGTDPTDPTDPSDDCTCQLLSSIDSKTKDYTQILAEIKTAVENIDIDVDFQPVVNAITYVQEEIATVRVVLNSHTSILQTTADHAYDISTNTTELLGYLRDNADLSGQLQGLQDKAASIENLAGNLTTSAQFASFRDAVIDFEQEKLDYLSDFSTHLASLDSNLGTIEGDVSLIQQDVDNISTHVASIQSDTSTYLPYLQDIKLALENFDITLPELDVDVDVGGGSSGGGGTLPDTGQELGELNSRTYFDTLHALVENYYESDNGLQVQGGNGGTGVQNQFGIFIAEGNIPSFPIQPGSLPIEGLRSETEGGDSTLGGFGTKTKFTFNPPIPANNGLTDWYVSNWEAEFEKPITADMSFYVEPVLGSVSIAQFVNTACYLLLALWSFYAISEEFRRYG